MSRKLNSCGLASVTDDACDAPAAYRIEARVSDGRQVVLYLCHEHIHRAWHLSQLLVAQRFPDQGPRVRSIHLHQIAAKVSVAEAAS
ncbi:MAG TPA: hypothetical protein VFQ00_11070 [Terriglobales bacterium]|nr:hypothetical protein [Terriglobales bacterium]